MRKSRADLDVGIVGDDDRYVRGEIPAVGAAAAAREALLEHRQMRLRESLRREEDRQPAVRDLRRERDVLRADRGEVDRDVRAGRVDDQLERLAEPGRALAAVYGMS